MARRLLAGPTADGADPLVTFAYWRRLGGVPAHRIDPRDLRAELERETVREAEQFMAMSPEQQLRAIFGEHDPSDDEIPF